MTARFVVEPLGASHDRGTFSCGVAALDRYFREHVTQDMRRRLTNCFVALAADGSVAGYYTFAATSLLMSELTAVESKRLPRYPLLPAGLIGRLAVDTRHARQGLGGALIVDAIRRAARSELGIFALVVDAKDDTAARFYQHHGFRPLISRPLSFYLLVAEVLRRLSGSAT